MTTDHDDERDAIERDFDVATMRGKGAAWLIGMVTALLALLWYGTTHAQTITAPTPVTPFDWQCQDASGAKLSDHASYTQALVDCWNNRTGDRIQGGTYKLPARTFPNRTPTISGAPIGAIEAGKAYSFLPTAVDPDGDTLGFSIQNRPTWATFAPASGLLAGTPAAADVGISSSIVITVSDGKASASTSAFSITVTAPPPPPPVDCVVSAWSDWLLGTPTACVNGAQSRSDTRSRTVITTASNGGSACPALTESRTVPLTCTSPPPALTAPVLAVPTLGPNAADPTRFNIALSWSAVTGATGYEVRRCTGVNCNSFTIIKTVTSSPYTNTNLPAGFSYKYEVRAMNGTTAGPQSNIVTIVTTAAPPPPPPPPPPPVAGSASLKWAAPTQNTDGSALTTLAGYRIVYGTSATNLTQTVQVANASMTAYVLDGLAAGTWYFALRAYTSVGYESVDSAVVSKVVQ